MHVDSEFVNDAISYRLESAEWRPAIEIIDAIAAQNPNSRAEKQMVAGGWMVYAGPESAFNHMIGMGLRGPVSSEEFDRVEEFYRSRGSVCEVVVSPYADASLMRHLGDRGYRVTEWNSVLVRKLDSGERFEAAAVEVHAVRPEETMLWAEVIARGWADIAAVSPELFATMAAAPSAMLFLAYLDGKPAGAAGVSIFPEHGIAPLHGASTLPEFRNRGVQTALVRARLRAAAEAGCELAAVCAAPGSITQRNAERNGFHVAYTKIAMQRQFGEPR